MNTFKSALEHCDGFLEGFILEDEFSGRLIGMIKWQSKPPMENSIHHAIHAVKDDDSAQWELKPTEVFYLNNEVIF